MDVQRIRAKMVHRIIRRVQVARIRAWDFLAALQSSKSLESSFVLWTSPADVSHRAVAFALKPYLCQFRRNVVIEPQSGFAIADYGLLIETSVSNAFAARDRYLGEMFNLPPLWRYVRARIRRRYLMELEEVVVLSTAWSSNYFHFYRDFLPKILMLEEANIDPAIPVLVPDRLFDQPFFREAIQSKRLAQWNFISPQGKFIKSKSIVFCSATQFVVMDRSIEAGPEILSRSAAGLKYVESPAQIIALLDLADGSPPPRAERRIFLTRSPVRERNLSNYDEIERLVRERDFEVIDTDGMSLREQAQLFRECRYLIGIHGAGLTNVIFAYEHDLSLLQLRQPGEEHLWTDFDLMCHALGFDHQEIIGTSEHGPEYFPSLGSSRYTSFHVDVAVLRAGIDRMLAAPTSV